MNTISKNRIPKRLVRTVGIAAAAALLFIPGRAIIESQDHPPAWDLKAFVPGVKHGLPKLQSALARLVEIEETEGPSRADVYARTRKMPGADGNIRVVSSADGAGSLKPMSAMTALLSSRVRALGGRVEITRRGLVQHWIPIASLRELAADPLVKFIRLPLRPFKHKSLSEGVAATGADKWRNLVAYRNQTPARIAVLDLGFEGYSGLLGSDLPKSVTTRSFRMDGDIQAGEDHGAACAEIVYDMAPDAKLYLVNIDTDVEQHDAVDWLISQKVDVISYSLGWYNAGAGNGTGPIDEDVEVAAAGGIAWASSAGNAALDHWDGSFNDPDNDGILNFSGSDELLDFYVPAYETVGAFLNWKDWGAWDGYDYSGSNQDYDLYLYYWNGSFYQFVDSSKGDQTGTQWPTEEIYGYYSTQPGYWAVAIHKWSATKNVKLELFTLGNSRAIDYNVPQRSLTIPGEAVSALAAGATDWQTDALHSYSSLGPTHDGRMKPDFGAPSGVSTTSFGANNFYGTSASAPHLAGAIGLLKGMTPYSLDKIIEILRARAVDLGDPGPDNKFGYGRLNVKKR